MKSLEDINAFQSELFEWQNEKFPQATTESAFEHLRRELVEIQDNPSDKKEWADVLMLYLCAASKNDITLLEIVQTAMDKFETDLKHRQWGEPDEYGVVETAGKGK